MEISVNKSFTFLEVLVVILIIFTIIFIAIPQYIQSIKNAILREASAGIDLIISAEKIYKVDIGSYCACSSTQDCNSKLGLKLPLTANWNYTVTSIGGGAWRVNAQYIGNRSDINRCYKDFYSNGNTSSLICN